MEFDPGFNIDVTLKPLGFRYGKNTFGPVVENRALDDIRKSLRDPACSGPEIVYAIAMDIGKREHLADLEERHLLFGAVIYERGSLGNEPIRSQGHVHAVSPHSGRSTPELYEIWDGRAVIYMQERVTDNPGRCFAVEAGPGDVVLVPPGWGHATISADPDQQLVFGAWCDRKFAFEYDAVRNRGGLAWFPLIDRGSLRWEHNPSWEYTKLIKKTPERYSQLGIEDNVPIYTQYESDNERFMFVPEPDKVNNFWDDFIP